MCDTFASLQHFGSGWRISGKLFVWCSIVCERRIDMLAACFHQLVNRVDYVEGWTFLVCETLEKCAP